MTIISPFSNDDSCVSKGRKPATDLPSQFQSIIIEGFGFTKLDTLLVQMLGGVFQIIFVALSAIGSTYIKNSRTYWMALMSAFSLAGAAMIRDMPKENIWGRFMGYCLIIAFSANFPLTFAMVTANTAGFTKKSVVVSMVCQALGRSRHN